MYKIDQVTNDTLQRQTLILLDGSTVTITMYFIPLQYGWFITELTYKDFTLKGQRIVVSPNMLNQFRNQIPFGLACFSTANREPSQQDDFSSGAATLYILSEEEVTAYAEYLSGQVTT